MAQQGTEQSKLPFPSNNSFKKLLSDVLQLETKF